MPLGLGYSNGTAMPEDERARVLADAAANGYSAELGLADAPAAPPSAGEAAAGSVQPSPGMDPAAGTQPITANEPLIDYKKNPLAAIGHVLSSVAAGMQGAPMPGVALREQRAEEQKLKQQSELQAQARRVQNFSLALQLAEATIPIVTAQPPDQRETVLKDLTGRYAGIPGLEGVENFVRAAVDGKIKNAQAIMGLLKDPIGSTELLSQIAVTNPALIEKIVETRATAQAGRATPKEAADVAGAVRGAENEADIAAGKGPKSAEEEAYGEYLKTLGRRQAEKEVGPSDYETAQIANMRATRAETERHNLVTEAATKAQADIASGDRARQREGARQSYDMAINSLGRLVGVKDEKTGARTLHPGFKGAVGKYGPALTWFGNWKISPWALPGTERANFEEELETFKAQTFLPMVESLRGLGALTDAEGSRLTNAVGALSTSMTEQAFIKSADEILKALEAKKSLIPGGQSGFTIEKVED